MHSKYTLFIVILDSDNALNFSYVKQNVSIFFKTISEKLQYAHNNKLLFWKTMIFLL